MAFNTLQLAHHGGIATLTLDRPDKRNAISYELIDELLAALDEVAQSALRARFGPVSEEEMGRRAAETGYELTCFAEPAGPVRCQ